MVGSSVPFQWDFTWVIFGDQEGQQKHTTALNTIKFIMKPKPVFTIIFSLFLASKLWSQTIDETYNFANSQFLAGDYMQAVTEYQRVALFDTDNSYNDVYQKIGDAFLP